jgi:hypothetical protein
MTKRKLYADEISHIDPLGCGSTVGYVVGKGRRAGIFGEVHLSDCDRKIQWYFSNDTEYVMKIDKAIAILIRFREELVKARRRRS